MERARSFGQRVKELETWAAQSQERVHLIITLAVVAIAMIVLVAVGIAAWVWIPPDVADKL